MLRWAVAAGRRGHLPRQPRRARPRLPAQPRLRVDRDHPRRPRAGPPPAHLDRRTRCSSRPSAATSPSRSRTTPRPARASTPSRSSEPLQSLADADVHYARVGPLILLRIRPYKETAWRHLVFNTRTKGVVRLDGIGQACQRLPEDHGIIFPGGYYLTTGVREDLRHRRRRPGLRAGDPLAQRRGRALRLPRRGRGAHPAAAVQRDPQGGGHAAVLPRLLAVRRRHAGRSSGPPPRSRPGSTRCRSGRRRSVSDAYAAAPAGRHRPAGPGRQRRPGARHLRRAVGGPDGRRDEPVRCRCSRR